MNFSSNRTCGLLAAATSVTLVTLASAVYAGPDEPCGALETVATPGQGEDGKVLTSIAVRGSTGFTLGRSYPQGSGPFVPLLYRYNGAEWVDQPLPPLSGPASEPVLMAAGMSAATGTTAWIVGWVTVPPPTNFLPLIARWRNGSFDRVDTPQLRPQTVYPFGPRSGFGNDVVVIAENDVWTVGQANGYGDAVTSSVAMALHWNGSNWQDVPTPIVASRSHTFDAVSASASDNVWAVGTSRNVGGPFLGFIQRWNGSSWSVVSHPALSIPASQFYEVLALSPSDVWVAGAINYTAPLVYHWDGSTWQSRLLPGNTGIITMAGTGTNDIWAIAADAAGSVMHWDGASWTPVSNPPPPPGQVDSMRALTVAGPCDVWAAGAQMDATGFHGTHIEHLVANAPTCPADFSGDGTVTSQDLFDFLSAFFMDYADFNHDGVTNSQDFFEFLAAFFAGC